MHIYFENIKKTSKFTGAHLMSQQALTGNKGGAFTDNIEKSSNAMSMTRRTKSSEKG